MRDKFACLKEVSHATAQNIFDIIIKFLLENNVPYKSNLIGFVSDGANAMFGCKNFVKTLLEEEVPGLFVMKCFCHSMALCASCAAEKLPKTVEDLLKDIYTYMKLSFKRQSEFKQFQIFIDAKPHKILRM